MYLLRSPSDMLAALERAFRTVTEAACFRTQFPSANITHQGAEGSGSFADAFGADSSLPLFILVVFRANPPMFSSVLAYTEHFAERRQLLTEKGYALTQAR